MRMHGQHEGQWKNLRKVQVGLGRVFCMSAGANVSAAPLLENPTVVVSLCCCSLKASAHFREISCALLLLTICHSDQGSRSHGERDSETARDCLVDVHWEGSCHSFRERCGRFRAQGRERSQGRRQDTGAQEPAESRAIMRYIADKFEGQGTPLYGKTPAESALVEQWLEVEAQNFNAACKDCLKYAAASPVDEEKLAQSLEKLRKVLDVYEARLATSEFLAGDFVSLADLSHLPTGWKLFDKYKQGSACFEGRPHVKAWWAAISSRPAWKRVLAMI